jgi:hypothetical protein
LKHVTQPLFVTSWFMRATAGAGRPSRLEMPTKTGIDSKNCACTHKNLPFLSVWLLQLSYLRGQNTPERKISYGRACHSLPTFECLGSSKVEGCV